MTSTVRLFKNCLIEKEKNFVIDSGYYDYYEEGQEHNPLEAYLASLSDTITLTNFQYIKQGLSISIKINMAQSKLDFISNNNINYISIQNGSEKIMYYFVISKEWRGENTINFLLEMDTLNSFKYNIDYKVNKKTLIHRQHQDRYEFDGETQFVYRIDFRSEEINAPVYKITEETLHDVNNPSDIEFALYYSNNGSNENDPIKCQLVPSVPFEAKSYETENFVINSSIIPDGKTAIVTALYNPHNFGYNNIVNKYTRFGYIQNGEAKELRATITPTVNGDVPQTSYAFQNDGGVIKVYGIFFFPGGMGMGAAINISYLFSSADIQDAKLNCLDPYDDEINVYEMTNADFANGSGVNLLYFTTNCIHADDYNESYLVSSTIETSQYINSINQIDRTLSTNIKIIYCPYCPSELRYIESTGQIELSQMWTINFNAGTITLNDFNSDLVNDITTDTSELFRYFTLFDDNGGGGADALRNVIEGEEDRTFKDTKLYHSDFYRPTFVYDSFTKVFPMEQIYFRDYINNDNKYFKFKFYTTKNIQSKFLFVFPYEYYRTVETYPNALPVTRNNEGVLYNSSYLNYVRTGYNYDVKAKDRDLQVGAIKLGLSTVGFKGTSSDTAGIISSVVDYAKTTAQNEDNMQRKLLELQMESVSVKNADDYDLLKAYSGNLAKLCYYSVSNDMQNALDDLFYYAGYKYGRQGMPEVDSRLFFNFVQADLVIDSYNNLTDDILFDIKSKFSSGVTFLHRNNTRSRGNFLDFEQITENIETSIVEYYNE